jgi:trimethylamine--corrinoid protein Co-methyltransferase
MIRLMDKVFHIYSLGKERNRDGLETDPHRRWD